MAILKHLSSKSANYGRAVEYLMYEQDRLTNRSLENENGNLVMRENFLIDSLECNVATFDFECEELNKKYRKNLSYNDVKSHHYIISFDPKDSVEGKLTIKDAQKIGMDFAKKNFPGHQAIVCTHDDGENKSGNIHVHIIINSLRKRDVDRQAFMERKCDNLAGYKHHLTNQYLEYLKKDLMKVCKKEHLNQVDLLSPAKKKVTEREYWAKERGTHKKGSKFELTKDKIRNAIDDVASRCKSEKEFAKILKSEYHITLKVSRGRYSYVLPNRDKAIRGRTLGTNYTEEYLREQFKLNRTQYKNASHEVSDYDTNIAKLESLRSDIRYPKAFTMRTNIPFVRDLQNSAITTTNRAYDRRMKINNLKEMADTIIYMEEHGIDSRISLEKAYDNRLHKTSEARSALRKSEDAIKGLNEQIHYTGQYLANKGVYNAYTKARDKSRFRFEHRREIVLYEAAIRYLREHADDGTLPSRPYIKTAPGKIATLNTLKATRDKLIKQQQSIRTRYYSARDKEKELYTIKRNVDIMLEDRSHNRNRDRVISYER